MSSFLTLLCPSLPPSLDLSGASVLPEHLSAIAARLLPPSPSSSQQDQAASSNGRGQSVSQHPLLLLPPPALNPPPLRLSVGRTPAAAPDGPFSSVPTSGVGLAPCLRSLSLRRRRPALSDLTTAPPHHHPSKQQQQQRHGIHQVGAHPPCLPASQPVVLPCVPDECRRVCDAVVCVVLLSCCGPWGRRGRGAGCRHWT